MTAHLLQWKYWEITICINYLSFLLKIIFRDWVARFFFPFINNSFGDGGCLVCYSEFPLFSIHCDSYLWISQENNGSSSSVFFPGCSVMCSGSVLPFPLTEVGNTFICHWWNYGFFCQTFVGSSHVVLPLLPIHVQYFGVVIFRLVGILTTVI